MQVALLHAVLQDFCSQNTKGLADVKKGLHIIPTYDKKIYSTARKTTAVKYATAVEY